MTRTIDPEGRETALAEGGYATGFAYNQNDQITAITLPGGVQESAQYDANNRLTVWHDPGPGQDATYAYGYDAAGRVTAFTAVSGTDTLGYDAHGRLTADCGPQVVAKSADHCYRWAYDGDGNITSATSDLGGPITYTYILPGQPDALARIDQPGYPNPAVYYAYDNSGDTVAITSPVTGSLTDPRATNTHIAYDAQGRPATITLRDGRTIGMAYNAQGERASYTVVTGTNTTLYSAQFAYNGDGELAQAAVYSATVSGSVQYTDSYVYGANGMPVEFARQQNGATSRYWYETDGRGDIVAVTSITGSVVDSYQYDLWGEELPDTAHEQVPQRLRYAGLWYDSEPECSWDSAGGRYYDPELERYLQPDGSGARDYVYAGDDPIAARGVPGGTRGGVASGAPGASPDLNCEGVTQDTPACSGGGGDVGGAPNDNGGVGSGNTNEPSDPEGGPALVGVRLWPNLEPNDLQDVNPRLVVQAKPLKFNDLRGSRFIYVISKARRLLALREPTLYHHPDLVGGDDVYFAGEMQFNRSGELEYWNNHSGHYRPQPTIDELGKISQWLQRYGPWPIRATLANYRGSGG